jgi:hypothetical protein
MLWRHPGTAPGWQRGKAGELAGLWSCRPGLPRCDRFQHGGKPFLCDLRVVRRLRPQPIPV